MIKMGFINNGEQEIMELCKDLIDGKFDDAIDNAIFLEGLRHQKEVLINTMKDNELTLMEAYIKIFEDNLKGEYDKFTGVSDEEVVELYNKHMENINENDTVEVLGLAYEDMDSLKDEIEILKRSIRVAKNIRMTVA